MSSMFRGSRIAAVAAAGALVVGGLGGAADAMTAAAPKSTAPKVKVRTPAKLPKVIDARFGVHGGSKGFDRVVFDLRGPAPGFNVRYVKRLRECGTGKVVGAPGRKYLRVTLQPAHAHNNKGNSTYRGPGRGAAAKIGMPTIKGFRMICDFEGQVSFGLGLDHKAGFRVRTLSSPTRIYVDVAH